MSDDTRNVCEGCVYYAANGADSYFDGEDGAEDLARIEAAHTAQEIIALCSVYPDSDPDGHGEPLGESFSWSDCQVCGLSLGGSRYTVTVVTR